MRRKLPRYPIYVPSRGRFENCMTAKWLTEDRVPFHLVVNEDQEDEYRTRYADGNRYCRLLVLPDDTAAKEGWGLLYARNWIMDHSIELGAKRHLQFDDNIRRMRRRANGQKIPVRASLGIRCLEDFTDRYSNIAISGFNYSTFVLPDSKKPFFQNCHVYSASLINNEAGFRWRLQYNDDTDICLQALAGGWCTVLMNLFMVDKTRTMTLKGGNTNDLYTIQDGRLKMSRQLERMWPGVVETRRRFRRPQHYVKDSWRRFDAPLKPVDPDAPPFDAQEYVGRCTQARDEIKNPEIKQIARKYGLDV